MEADLTHVVLERHPGKICYQEKPVRNIIAGRVGSQTLND